MNRQEQALLQVVRIANRGYQFFVAAYPRLRDSEVRTAFAYISDTKRRLIADLTPWTGHCEPDANDAFSPAAVVEKMYTNLSDSFRNHDPAYSANALAFGEEQLLRQVERAFECTASTRLKDTLRAYYPELRICHEAMWRLRQRMVA